MTANQINYQQLEETRRANQTREQETERHNRRTESQTDRQLDLTDLHNREQHQLWGAQTKESEARTFGTWIDNVFKPAEKITGIFSQTTNSAANLLKGLGSFL